MHAAFRYVLCQRQGTIISILCLALALDTCPSLRHHHKTQTSHTWYSCSDGQRSLSDYSFTNWSLSASHGSTTIAWLWNFVSGFTSSAFSHTRRCNSSRHQAASSRKPVPCFTPQTAAEGNPNALIQHEPPAGCSANAAPRNRKTKNTSGRQSARRSKCRHPHTSQGWQRRPYSRNAAPR